MATPEEKMSQHELELLAAKHATPPAPIAATTKELARGKDLMTPIAAQTESLLAILAEAKADYDANPPKNREPIPGQTWQELAAQTEKMVDCGGNVHDPTSYCRPSGCTPANETKLAEQVDAARLDDCEMCDKATHPLMWHKGALVHHIFGRSGYYLCKRAASLKHETQPPSEKQLDAIVLCVAELPDRSSPDDWPEVMLVTAEELKTIIRETLASSPLETPTAVPTSTFTDVQKAAFRKTSDLLESLRPTPAPADTGAAEPKASWVATNEVVFFKPLASTGDTPQPQDALTTRKWIIEQSLNLMVGFVPAGIDLDKPLSDVVPAWNELCSNILNAAMERTDK